MHNLTIESVVEPLLHDPDWGHHLSDRALWVLGSVVAPNSFVVVHYADPWCRRSFGNRRRLLLAVRRGLARPLPSEADPGLERLTHRVNDPNGPFHQPEDAWIPTIRDGCQQIRSRLAIWSGEQMSNHLMRITFRMADADRQALLDRLGFTIHTTPVGGDAADGDSVFCTTFQPPPNWDARRRRVSLETVCAFGEAFRAWLGWDTPLEPRGDWDRLIPHGLSNCWYTDRSMPR